MQHQESQHASKWWLFPRKHSGIYHRDRWPLWIAPMLFANDRISEKQQQRKNEPHPTLRAHELRQVCVIKFLSWWRKQSTMGYNEVDVYFGYLTRVYKCCHMACFVWNACITVCVLEKSELLYYKGRMYSFIISFLLIYSLSNARSHQQIKLCAKLLLIKRWKMVMRYNPLDPTYRCHICLRSSLQI